MVLKDFTSHQNLNDNLFFSIKLNEVFVLFVHPLFEFGSRFFIMLLIVLLEQKKSCNSPLTTFLTNPLKVEVNLVLGVTERSDYSYIGLDGFYC